jgi:hypothetical protein
MMLKDDIEMAIGEIDSFLYDPVYQLSFSNETYVYRMKLMEVSMILKDALRHEEYTGRSTKDERSIAE